MFNSYLAAIKFMESSDEFGEEDIAKIGLLVEENSKRSRVDDIAKIGKLVEENTKRSRVEDPRVASEVIVKPKS